MNILLLNDNPVVTKLVTLSAQKTGNEILIASNIEEIPEGSYDLLIVDEALYTPVLFDELESKISFKRSLYMLSRGVASVDGFDNEVKKPFLPTDLVELLSAIAISVANVTEKQKEPEIDLDNLDLEDDLDLDETLSATAKEDDLDLDDLGDLDFDLDSFDLNDLDLDTEGSESDETASVLDQDDVDEVKNLLDETDDDELKLDELDDDFSFDDLDLEDEHVETKEEPKIELLEEEKLEDELEDDFNFDDLDLEEELLKEVAAEEEPTIDQVDEPSSIEEDTLLDELNDEDFSFDELEDKIEEAVGALSSEDLEQEIDLDLEDLSELSSLDEKSLKIALGEEVEEESDEITSGDEEFKDEIIDELDDAVVVQESSSVPNIEVKDEKTDGIEALKTLLKALNNEDVVASLKGMNVSINISFGSNSEK